MVLEAGDIAKAAGVAYESMLHAALALEKQKLGFASDEPDKVVAVFRNEFFDTELFFDPFSGGKFAQYFFQAHERRGVRHTTETARQLIEEAQLFIEASHSCYARMAAAPVLV